MPKDDIFVPAQAGAASPNRQLHLNGWRGLCILLVLVGHFSPIHAIDIGMLGVEMFFVLSGRLMAEILFLKKSALLPFYVRRFSRVWPALFLYTAFCAALFTRTTGFLHVSAAAILAALTFTTNYKIDLFGQTQLLDHTWSLGVSEMTYLLLGLLAFLCRNRAPATARAAILFCAAAATLNGWLQSYLFPQHLSATDWVHNFYRYGDSDIRCASILYASFLYLQVRAHPIRWPAAATLGFLGVAILIFKNGIPPEIQYTLGTLMLALALITLENPANKLRKILASKALILLGAYSYSIYVWQQLFYKLFQNFRYTGALSPREGLILRPAFILAAITAGVLSFYLIETPARRFINNRFAPPKKKDYVPEELEAARAVL